MSDCYYGAEACRKGHMPDCPLHRWDNANKVRLTPEVLEASKSQPGDFHRLHVWVQRHTGSWACTNCGLIASDRTQADLLVACSNDKPGQDPQRVHDPHPESGMPPVPKSSWTLVGNTWVRDVG